MALLDLTFLLPFFFVLAIVYGSLEVSKVFENRGVKALIGVVLGFFAASSPATVEFIFFILPYATVFFVGFFLLGFLMSFFKEKKGEKRDYTLIAVILALAVLFLSSSDSLGIFNLENQNFIGMIVLLIIALILYSVYQIKDTR